MNLATAIAIAADGFKNTIDKGGQPYILHCIRVMNNLHTNDPELQSIAMLHDCPEDGVCTIKDLYNYGFSDRVMKALILLTHQKDVPYMDYIKAISTNKDATLVKLADLKDNSDITRLKGLTKKDHERMEKYCVAYTYLSKI